MHKHIRTVGDRWFRRRGTTTQPVADRPDAHFVPIAVDGHTIEFAVDPVSGDPMTQELMEGQLPPDVTGELWRHLIRPEHSVIDAGAHLGTFSLPAARIGARVLAVEASPLNSDLLELARQRNSFANLRVLHAAVSSRSGTASFSAYGPWGHVTSAGEQPGLEVRAVALDDVLTESDWDRVDLVKIDVEGSELEALAGLRHQLDAESAPLVLIESNAHTLHQFGLTPSDLIATLQSSGYGCYLIDRVHGRQLVPVAAADIQPECFVDYLAFKGGPPHGLEPWQIVQPFQQLELSRRVAATCQSVAPEIREYGERLLAAGPQWLADGVRSALGTPANGETRTA